MSSCAGSPSVSPDEEPIKIKPAPLLSSLGSLCLSYDLTSGYCSKVKKYIGILPESRIGNKLLTGLVIAKMILGNISLELGK